jgi:hypothetical protein
MNTQQIQESLDLVVRVANRVNHEIALHCRNCLDKLLHALPGPAKPAAQRLSHLLQ